MVLKRGSRCFPRIDAARSRGFDEPPSNGWRTFAFDAAMRLGAKLLSSSGRKKSLVTGGDVRTGRAKGFAPRNLSIEFKGEDLRLCSSIGF